MERARLQIALDAPHHLSVVADVVKWAHTIEVGTPLIMRFGLSIITTVRQLAGDASVLADLKLVDGARHTSQAALAAGADLITVLSSASSATLAAALDEVGWHGGTVVADSIVDGRSVDEIVDATSECSCVVVHVPNDARFAGTDADDRFERVVQMRGRCRSIAVAGGIDATNLSTVLALGPDVVVVGRAITEARSPEAAAEWFAGQLS